MTFGASLRLSKYSKIPHASPIPSEDKLSVLLSLSIGHMVFELTALVRPPAKFVNHEQTAPRHLYQIEGHLLQIAHERAWDLNQSALKNPKVGHARPLNSPWRHSHVYSFL